MARKKQKKKKKNVAPVNRAKHKREYIESFLKFANSMGFSEISEDLTENRKGLIYNLRITQPRIIIDASENTCDNRKMVESDINEFLDDTHIWKNPVYPTITRREFYVQGFQLASFITSLERSAQHADNELYVLLRERHDKYIDEYYNGLNTFVGYMIYLGAVYSAPDRRYYWFCSEFEKKITGSGLISYYCLRLYNHNCEKRKVLIDNEPRTIYRLGFPKHKTGFNWATINSVELPIKTVNMKKSLPVYVQMHALHRMEERLDCVNYYMSVLFLNDSVEHCKIVTSPSGDMLLEYRYDKIKLGYLKIDMLEDILVIRTFLFITNNNTPEGARLHRIAGLQLEDKKFLQIDRLSTFLQPDVRNNKFICSLFNEAGCGELLKLNKEFFNLRPKSRVASTIESYFTKRDEHIHEMQIS